MFFFIISPGVSLSFCVLKLVKKIGWNISKLLIIGFKETVHASEHDHSW